YGYTPFGVSQVMGAMYEVQMASDYEWIVRHQGLSLDLVTGNYYNRMREYSPTLGRFIQKDPTLFDAGDVNLYRYLDNDAVGELDPSGLAKVTIEIFYNQQEASRLRLPITRGAQAETERIINNAVMRFAVPSWKVQLYWRPVTTQKGFDSAPKGIVERPSDTSSQTAGHLVLLGTGYIYRACKSNSYSYPENTTVRLSLDVKPKGPGQDVFGQGSDYGMVVYRDNIWGAADANLLTAQQKTQILGGTIAHEIMHALGKNSHANPGSIDSESLSLSGLGEDVYSDETAKYILQTLGIPLR
ncbi:MAG: RHS repeat-associated core domain-containing protein, partial [Bacteroidales bacterium]|nr:RHS repeat-associated core domain-containing protein [Bacteroidales bacterium]